MTDRFGMLMLGIPTACAALMWVCIYDSEGVTVVRALGAISILATGAVAAVEADLLRGTGTDGPTRIRRVEWAAFWFVAHLAAWLLAYPSYLRWRSRYGAKNLLRGATLVAAGFVATLLCGTLWAGSASDFLRDLFP